MSDWLARLRPTNYVYLLLHLLIAGAGFVMMAQKGVAMQAIGSSFVATGITGWVIFIYIFLSEDTRAKLRLVAEAGITAVFTARGSTIRSQYDQRLDRAKSQLDLLGFGQNTLRQDYAGQFANWKTKACIRILLIDPDFPTRTTSYARQRDGEEGATAGTIATEVQSFLRDTRPLWDERFQVRLYRCLPTVSMFRIDDEILWGPYLAKRVSRNSPTFVVRRGGELFESLQTHFDAIWMSEDLSREAPP